MNQYFPVTAAPLPFTPKILGPDTAVVFLVKPLTQADMDRLGFELFRFNIVPVTTDTFRATMIDEIFEIYGEVEGEEKAALMDEFWQSEDLFSNQLADWDIAERDRLWDESRGAPKRPAAPVPQRTMPVRRRAKAQLFAEEVKSRSRRMRDLTIEMQSYEPRQREGITRLVLEGWSGVKTPFAKPDGIVSEEAYEALKAEIGKPALAELHEFIMSLGSVDEDERGNSASPPESGSALTGSQEPSGEADSSDGPFPADKTESIAPGMPTPGNESAKTTEQSSTSTSAASGEIQSIEGSPTGKA